MDTPATAIQPTVNNKQEEDNHNFIQAINTGLADLESGRELSIDEAKARLGLQ